MSNFVGTFPSVGSLLSALLQVDYIWTATCMLYRSVGMTANATSLDRRITRKYYKY